MTSERNAGSGEAFSGLRQFGRKTRRSGMHLGTDMDRRRRAWCASSPFADSRFPVSLRPPAKRSIHSRPSGLSMTSTIPNRGAQHANATRRRFRFDWN
jgi:hypothetical protein